VAVALSLSGVLWTGVFWDGVARAQESPRAEAEAVEFTQDVRPILADRCFSCHGPDATHREADLRLDTRDGLFAESDADEAIVKPQDLEHSLLWQRITADDESERMPPVDSKLALNDHEIEVLRRWIEQGAEWQQHWAFRPIAAAPLPNVEIPAWSQNPIDRFVGARMKAEGLEPSPPATKERLLRRLRFDLTGLPPTLEEIDAFLADTREDAYERLVDRLLALPQYGERMAVDWLDVARYADTYGYQSDVYRAMWPWRDWVVRSFNENLPYDQLVTWQLAGDLLPAATQEQVLATAFNRNHRQTNEGGSVEEEFRAEYVADRVITFGTAMLGLTLECARCHDHKFDPLTQAEFYQLAACFNNIDESGLYSHFTDAVPTPTLLMMDAAQRVRRAELERATEDAEQKLRDHDASQLAACEAWMRAGPPAAACTGLIGDFPLDAIEGNSVANRADSAKSGTVAESPELVAGRVGQALKLSGENAISVPTGGDFTRHQPFSLDVWIEVPDEKDRAVILHRSKSWTDAGSRGYELLIEDGRLTAALIHFWPGNALAIRTRDKIPLQRWVHVALTYDGSSRAGGLMLYLDGQKADCDVVRDNLYKEITGGGAITMDVGQRFRDRGFKGGVVDELKVFDRCLTAVEVLQLHDGLSLSQCLQGSWDDLDETQRGQVLQYYLANYDPTHRQLLTELKQRREEQGAFVEGIPEIMVMREMPEPRTTYVLRRGAYDARGAVVGPGVPDCLPAWPADQPRNRLGLARWLTDPQHPLLARVTVNRLWQSFFGRGIVSTAGDFGSQGEQPTHPELLDWLARHFIDSGWNTKELVRLMVTSQTYRQDSDCSPQQRALDPENRWLARGVSYRMPAEMIRDNVLSVSGMLVGTQGGAPVKPYQPEGLWEEKSGLAYVRDKGEGSHRRSLYTFWKRTSPPPAMMTLDAPTREVCVARRQATSSPLQALVFWNDPQYVEAARALAERVVAMQLHSPQDELNALFRMLTGRHASSEELTVLQRFWDEQQAYFAADPQRATQFLSVGDHASAAGIDPIRLAALAAVAETLLSYDLTVMKR
jgi:hypothetical protein